MKVLRITFAFVCFLFPAAAASAQHTCDTIDSSPKGMHLAVYGDSYWHDRSVLRVRFLNGDPTVQERVKAVVPTWSAVCNMRFVFVTEGFAEVRVSLPQNTTQAFSNLGQEALTVPQNRPTVTLGGLYPETEEWWIRTLVLHEFGHALGFGHEHQHPEAGIPWDVQKVYEHYRGPPNCWTDDMIEANVLSRMSSTRYTRYDPKSIMHYPVPKELTIGGYEHGWNSDLSELDQEFAAKIYPFPVSTEPVTLQPLQAVVTLVNNTGGKLFYQIVNALDPTWTWRDANIEAGRESFWFVEGNASYVIRFDRSYAEGYQGRDYNLPHKIVVKAKDQLSTADGERYQFLPDADGLDLKTMGTAGAAAGFAVVSLVNNTPATIAYAIRDAHNTTDPWHSATLGPGIASFWFAGEGADFRVAFDYDYQEGYQDKEYQTPHEVVRGRASEQLRYEDGRKFQFLEYGRSVDLKTMNDPGANWIEWSIVTLVNDTPLTVNYAIIDTADPADAWHNATLDPGMESFWFAGPNANFLARFDWDYAEGYQDRQYRLPHNRIVNRAKEAITTGDGKRYHFVEVPGGLDLNSK